MSNDFEDSRQSPDSSAADDDSSQELAASAISDATVTSVPLDADSHATVRVPADGSSNGVVALGPRRRLGDFELIQELGRGGMGVVFEARQRSLDKRVAVKVLPFSGLLDKRAVKRFQNEAWAAARLQHRNIVPVYQVGNERDVHFYAMQYIDGGDLDDLFKCLREAAIRQPSRRATQSASPPRSHRTESSTPKGKATSAHTATSPSDPDAVSQEQRKQLGSTHKSGWSKGDTLASQHVLDLVKKNHSTSVPEFLAALVGMGIQVAEALHYAHEMGVVHRDIKPSNLLLDTQGEVWVADFGLAQIQNDTGVTATGAIVGTLRYLSPEQALGKRVGVDHRSDVYSLGVTLYELLTLTRAYRGESREQILRKVIFHDPIRPRKIDRRIPVELETIVTKAMSKNPTDRYQTAAEMAEDFRLFRDGKPIKGRKPTIPQHVARWASRNRPAVASAAALMLVTLIASLLVAGISWNLFAATATALETEKAQKAEVERLLQRSEGLRLAANSALEGEDNPTRALLLAIEGARQYPGADTNGAILETLDTLHELRTLSGHPGPVGHLAFHGDGKKLISAAHRSRFDDGPDAAMIWNTETGDLIGEMKDEKTITSTAFSPDKFRILATSSPVSKLAMDDVDGEAASWSPSLWDSLSFEKLLSFEDAYLFEAHPHVFDPAGRRAVLPSLGHTATIYDCIGGHGLIRLTGHDQRVVFAAFSPQGDRVVTASDDNTVRVWDADSGEEIYQIDLWKQRDPTADRCVIDSVEFRADGRQLVTGSRPYGIHLWDLSTGARANDQHLKGGMATYWPDGTQVLTHVRNGADLAIRDVSSGTLLRTVKPKNGVLRRVTISPDGQWIATHGRSDSSLVAIWNAVRSDVHTVLKGHQLVVNDMAFSPDSKIIATASSDKTIRLWSLADGRDRATFPTGIWSTEPRAVASPDGKQLAIVGPKSSMAGRVLDFEQPQQAVELSSRIWMPGGTSTRFVASSGNKLSIHSIDNAAEQNSITSVNGRFFEAAINADGDRVAAFAGGGVVTLWLPDENRRMSLLVGSSQVFGLEFNSEGDRLASISADGFARIWDADTGELLDSLQNDAKVFDMEFSPDEKQVVAVTDQNRAIIWDLESSQKRVTLQSPGTAFDRMSFSFDGAKLISYRSNGSDAVQLWDAKTGNLESTFDVTGQVHVAVHPARNEALITSTELGAVIWQFDQNIRHPITDRSMIHGAFSSDGSQFIIGSGLPLQTRTSQLVTAPTNVTPSTLQRWSRDDLLQQESIEIAAGRMTDFQLSRNGRAFVNTIRQFGVVNHDVAKHEAIANIGGHAARVSAVLFTSDSRRLITASWDQTISVWNAADGEQLKTLSGHASAVHCAALTSDDRLLASGADDGQCILWNLESGEIEQRLELAQSPIRHVAFNSAGNQILALASDHSIHLYDLNLKQVVNLNVVAEQIAWAEFSPDGSSVLVIPHPPANPVIDAENAQPLDQTVDHNVFVVPINGDAITPLAHDGPVVTAHFDPTGEQVVSATKTGTVTLRNSKSGQVEKTFSNPGINVEAAVLNKSGEYLAVAGRNELSVWKVKEERKWLTVPKRRLFPDPPQRYNPFIPGAHRLVTRRIDTARFRDWPIDTADYARTRMPRLLSMEERSRFLIEPLPVAND